MGLPSRWSSAAAERARERRSWFSNSRIWVNTMPSKPSKQLAKFAKKAAAKRVAAKASMARRAAAPKSQSRDFAKPALLAGGNPKIAKSDGDAPVQAYIAAMPRWKREVGR